MAQKRKRNRRAQIGVRGSKGQVYKFCEKWLLPVLATVLVDVLSHMLENWWT